MEEDGSSETESSCDESKSRLLEAVDKDFINDSMFGRKLNGGCSHSVNNGIEKHATKTSLVSLRGPDNDYQQYNGLHVTPDFQKYVAKHLEKILDGQLKEKRRKVKPQLHQEPTGGVKLFTDSRVYLSSTEEIIVDKKRTNIKKRKKEHSSSSENSESDLERFTEAAVTPNWVLMQEGTKGWTQSSKGNKIVINSKGDVIEEKKAFK